jgi:hypothetical protein
MECVGRKGLFFLPGKHEAYHCLKNPWIHNARAFRYAIVCTQALCALCIASMKDYTVRSKLAKQLRRKLILSRVFVTEDGGRISNWFVLTTYRL